jgi:hypothetical protein
MRNALLRRGLLFWALARVMLMIVGAAPPVRNGRSLGVSAVLALLMAVGALGLLEARRRNEARFLANLGVSSTTIMAVSLLPGLLAEIALGVAGLQ